MFIPRPRRRPTRYLEIRPNPVQLPGAGYLGYGQGPSTMDGRVIEGVTKCFQDASETRARWDLEPYLHRIIYDGFASDYGIESDSEFSGWGLFSLNFLYNEEVEEHYDSLITCLTRAGANVLYGYYPEFGGSLTVRDVSPMVMPMASIVFECPLGFYDVLPRNWRRDEDTAGRGGRLPIAAPHSDAENVGEYNGWVSMAKGVMVDLGIEHVDNTIDEIDSAFTDGVHAFQEEYAELYDLEPTGWLDPKTVKALQTVYSQVYGSVPPLVPIYPTGEGLMVGYPAKEKGGKSIAGPLIGIGLCAAVAVFAGVMITR